MFHENGFKSFSFQFQKVVFPLFRCKIQNKRQECTWIILSENCISSSLKSKFGTDHTDETDGTLENQINKIQNAVIITCIRFYCVDDYDLYGTCHDKKMSPAWTIYK